MKRLGWIVVAFCGLCTAQATTVSGVVYWDKNKNNKYDQAEPPLAGVQISNGRDIVVTNAQGEYFIESYGEYPVFLIKPKGYQSPLKSNNSVLFYHSPEAGKNVQQHDFPLFQQTEQKEATFALLGDMQVDVKDDVHHVEKLVVEELIQSPPALVFPLGDLVFDHLHMFEPLAAVLGKIGSPVYYLAGNHDLDFDAPEDIQRRDRTYRKAFGPSYYGLEYADQVILVVNNIVPLPDGKYKGSIDEAQRTFIQNFLANYKGKRREIKVMMHIPIEFMEDKEAFVALFADFKEVFVATGHTHTQYHRYFDREQASPIHQLVAGAVCGAWWQGPHDIEGIPFAMMYDGTWKGYWLLETENNTLRYKVSGQSSQKQIEVWVPEVNEWDTSLAFMNDNYVYANVFAADKQTAVEVSFDQGVSWAPMEYHEGVDPHFQRLIEIQKQGKYKSLPISPIADAQRKSKHLWRYAIPAALTKGSHVIQVRALAPAVSLEHTETRIYTVYE